MDPPTRSDVELSPQPAKWMMLRRCPRHVPEPYITLYTPKCSSLTTSFHIPEYTPQIFPSISRCTDMSLNPEYSLVHLLFLINPLNPKPIFSLAYPDIPWLPHEAELGSTTQNPLRKNGIPQNDTHLYIQESLENPRRLLGGSIFWMVWGPGQQQAVDLTAQQARPKTFG